MAVTEPPHWHLDPAALTPREGFRVLLQDLDQISPVLTIEVRAQAIPHAGGSRASGERSRALSRRQRKSHSLHLGMVYCLADW